MPKGREERAPRKMKRAFLVFCEGRTEECYVQELRRRYRAPIRIVAIRQGQDISDETVRRETEREKISPEDRVEAFLMYDWDVPEVNARLESCAGTKICSNPCVELWFLLHLRNWRSSLDSEECVKTLRAEKGWNGYRKGDLSEPQRTLLWEKRDVAAQRAKALDEKRNPSTGVYKLLESIERSLT